MECAFQTAVPVVHSNGAACSLVSSSTVLRVCPMLGRRNMFAERRSGYGKAVSVRSCLESESSDVNRDDGVSSSGQSQSTSSSSSSSSSAAAAAAAGTTDNGEALVEAAMLCDVGRVGWLLSNGTDASYASSRGGSKMTALMWACAEGNDEIASLLLEHGAGVDARNSQLMTALQYAMDGMPSANPREAPPAGFPDDPERSSQPAPAQIPIVARVTGHVAIVNQLLQRGADISVRNGFDESILHTAARKAQTGLVRTLLAKGLPIDDTSSGFLETALHVAAKENHPEVVNLLCECGANIEARNRFGWTPLFWAAASGWTQVLQILIAKGANVNISAGEDGKRTTPLMEARRCAKPRDISKLLIRAGAIE